MTYQRDGFEVVKFLEPASFNAIKQYALSRLSTLFKMPSSDIELESYHIWGKERGVLHEQILGAKNRHCYPPDQIQKLLFNEILEQFLQTQGIEKYKIWDEGIGPLGFRLIRPNREDGYPFSCKDWGPAKNVLSVWIPIFGFEQEMMLNLVPGSHLLTYEKVLPKNSKFASDEYRLAHLPLQEECIRPKLSPGEAIIFHPRTIHAEACGNGTVTRFNFEFRIVPL